MQAQTSVVDQFIELSVRLTDKSMTLGAKLVWFHDVAVMNELYDAADILKEKIAQHKERVR